MATTNQLEVHKRQGLFAFFKTTLVTQGRPLKLGPNVQVSLIPKSVARGGNGLAREASPFPGSGKRRTRFLKENGISKPTHLELPVPAQRLISL